MIPQSKLCCIEFPPFLKLHDLVDAFQQNRDRVAIVHYAGHADSVSLMLQTWPGLGASASVPGEIHSAAESESAEIMRPQVLANACDSVLAPSNEILTVNHEPRLNPARLRIILRAARNEAGCSRGKSFRSLSDHYLNCERAPNNDEFVARSLGIDSRIGTRLFQSNLTRLLRQPVQTSHQPGLLLPRRRDNRYCWRPLRGSA